MIAKDSTLDPEKKKVEWETARLAACRAAARAWDAIAALYESGGEVTHKSEGPVTEADRLADKVIGESLREDYPAATHGYLTEETEDDVSRLERERVWIIDPIDGTKDFIKKNGNFTMHVGLVERLPDGKWYAVAAAVFRPVVKEMYSAVLGAGSRMERYEAGQPVGIPKPLRVSRRSAIPEMRAVISSSHRDAQLDRLMKHLKFGTVLSIGSIGIKLSLVARGDYDFYVNLARGKCREWDSCAPHLILSEAGGTLTDLAGGEIHYNQREVHLPRGLLASNNRIHETLMAKVAEFEAHDKH